MKMMIKIATVTVLVLLAAGSYYLFRPSVYVPTPAHSVCLGMGPEHGQLLPTLLPGESIYGLGLTYAQHIKETSWNYDPTIDPPVFRIKNRSLGSYPEYDYVRYPSYNNLMASADGTEPGLSAQLSDRFKAFPALMDYEVELALILLDDISVTALNDPIFAPRLAYVLANDISSRSLMVLGQGQLNDHQYYGAAKSLPGFTPVAENMWVPKTSLPNSTLCVVLTTEVNGVVKQHQSTSDQIYTPKQMLQFVSRAFPEDGLKRGTMILTGTPAGVVWKIDPWMPRLTRFFGMDRFTKLAFVFAKAKQQSWLKVGDQIRLSGEILGEINTQVVD